jgi:hypothetical protein
MLKRINIEYIYILQLLVIVHFRLFMIKKPLLQVLKPSIECVNLLIIGNQNAKFRIHNASYLVKCVDILIYLKDFFAIAIVIFRNISTFAFH